MKGVFGCALLALAIGTRVEITHLQKVIQLMEKMREKGKAEKRSEEVQFAAHKLFCDETTVEKHRTLAEAAESSASLKADIQKYAADASLLTKEISVLDEDISTWNGEIKAASDVREVEKADHAASLQSYAATADALQKAAAVLKETVDNQQLKKASLMQAVARMKEINVQHESSHRVSEPSSDAVPRAVAVLKKAAMRPRDINIQHESREVLGNANATQARNSIPRALAVMQKAEYDRKQKEASWAQLMKTLIPDSARKAIDIFLQQGGEDISSIWYRLVQEGQHNAEFKSHDVIELLDRLSDKFVDEHASLEREEMDSRHNYEMLMQDLKAQIAQATSDRAQKVAGRAKKLQAQADVVGDLKDTTATMQADQKYVSDLVATCKQTSAAFAERQQLRSDEIFAIGKAIDIISGDAVAGNAEKHLATMPPRHSSFAQLRSDSAIGDQDRAVKYLKAQAAKLNSRVLASMAAHASKDPLVKVQKMVKDLIVRLIAEADEETIHKAWCDSELATNEHTRKAKTEQVETLHAEVDQLQASISKITERISDFTAAVAELDTAMAEATRLRIPDRAKNAETISDAKEAQSAVAQAVTVLKELHAKAANSTALVQRPEIFGSSYKGMQSETTGVVSMLQVISSDFARLESETQAAEVSAQRDYDEFMADSKSDKSQKSVDIEHNSAKKQDESRALIQYTRLLEDAQKDLDASLAYFDKLKPSCTESGVGFQDRDDRRKDEVESLKEALKILNGSDVAGASRS